MKYDVIVVGRGPAGLISALEAWKQGTKHILILERDQELGGILNQCIHNGFDLHHFKERLTGPEYAGKFIEMLKNTNVEVLLDTMMLDIDEENRCIHAVNKKQGYMQLEGKAIMLNMRYCERTRGAIAIPGDHPAGVFAAGTARRYVSIGGYMVSKRVLILGSGNIGLIMVHRMGLEGAKAVGRVELCPYSNGLNRNIVQCLNDYDVPLHLSHTITDIQRDKRMEHITVREVDGKRQPIPGTETTFDVDTVLLSVGLIPESKLSRAAGLQVDPGTNGPMVYENMGTNAKDIFADGSVVHVHDLVNFVTAKSERAGRNATIYTIQGSPKAGRCIEMRNGNTVNYTVPQKIHIDNMDKFVEAIFRVNNVYKDMRICAISGDQRLAGFERRRMAPGEMGKIIVPKILLEKAGDEAIIRVEKASAQDMKSLICIVCPKGCHLSVGDENGYTVTSNNCLRGTEYGKTELIDPRRIITSIVHITAKTARRVPVKTEQSIPKGRIMNVMGALESVDVKTSVSAGDVVLKDVAGLGVNIVVTKSMGQQIERSIGYKADTQLFQWMWKDGRRSSILEQPGPL